MAIIAHPVDYVEDVLFVDLAAVYNIPAFLKCEGLNFAGSIKMKSARAMIRAAKRSGQLTTSSVLVESSSGNLGIALAMISAAEGYSFICVTDPRCNRISRLIMESMGATVVEVDEVDENGGFLGSRVNYVRELAERDPNVLWLNQYANEANADAHYETTAPSILRQFPDLQALFIGAGTTGTLLGCARYLRDVEHPARIIAVDARGSVTFGDSAAPRHIPGLGTSRRPELAAGVDIGTLVDDVVLVDEAETVATCRALARRGLFFGGSTGTVVHGMRSWIAAHAPCPVGPFVAIAPDLGDRYVETVYDKEWAARTFGTLPLDEPVLSPAPVAAK